MTYVPGTWHDHRRAYAGSETTWRLTLEQRAEDWAHGCGWCNEPYENHDKLQPLTTADAVTALPLPPVDPLKADITLARIFGSQLAHVDPKYTRALACAMVVADSLELGGAE